MALISKPDYTYIWASGGAVVEPSNTKKQTGWVAEVPPFQWENWAQNRQDQMLAHINQRGIAAWSGDTEYEAGGLSYVQGSNGTVYKSVAASGPATTIQDPTTDVSDTYWTVAFADVGAFLTQAAGDARYMQLSLNGSDIPSTSTFRANIGLTITNSSTDTTTGRITKVGDFGIGSNTPPQIGNMDDPLKAGGLYRYNSGTDTGTTPTGGAINGVVLVQPFSSTLARQVFREVVGTGGQTSSRLWERQINGATLGAWELITGSRLDSVRIDVASASTVNLTTAAPNTRHINITGTTAITGFTVAAGQCYFVRFAGVLTLTNGASLVTQSGANISTAAGDTCIIRATAANVVEVLCYTPGVPQELGYRQTWQNVTASRAASTTYTNTTGRPIQVMITINWSDNTDNFNFFVDGVAVLLDMEGGLFNWSSPIAVIVPAGSTYSITANYATPIKRWMELR